MGPIKYTIMKKLNNRQRAERIDDIFDVLVRRNSRKAVMRCPALLSIERRSAATNPDTLADTYNARVIYKQY